MATQFKTSFIPKKSLAPQKQIKGTSSASIFYFISTVIFLISLAITVGVFIYKTFTEQKITDMKSSLERARAAFDPTLIETIQRLDERIDVSNQLLNKHIAPTLFFRLLEVNTLESVRFLDLTFEALNDKQIDVSMKGEAKNFSSIALQSDLFGEHRGIDEPIFSGLNPNERGTVDFDLHMVLDASLINYEASIKDVLPDNIDETLLDTNSDIPEDFDSFRNPEGLESVETVIE